MKNMLVVTGPENAWARGTFDPEKYDRSEIGTATKQMHHIYEEHKGDQLHPDVLKYWEENGVKKEVFDVDKTKDEMTFSVLTPLQKEEGIQYPLVYCLHGGGEDIFSAEVYGYGELTGAGQCITVCPSASGHGNPRVEREFERILQFLEENNWIQPEYDTYLYMGESYNANGIPMARFGCFIGMPHTQCPMQAQLIWSYLSQFSRNLETGELTFRKWMVGGANR